MTAAVTRAQHLATAYQDSRERITALVAPLDDAAQRTPVAACPKWAVRDVVAHLYAVADEWADGRLGGPPTDEHTAAHVAQYADHTLSDLLARWSDAAARLDALATTDGLEPPLGDIACHEHDIRGALGRPGARDSLAVTHTADRLLTMLDSPIPLRVTVEDGEYISGPDHGDVETSLRTTRFDALRWRTGRRSRRQLAAMDWTGDPTPLLDHLYLFGPADADVIE